MPDTSRTRVQKYIDRAGLSGRVSVEALPGDASDRRYIRMGLSDGASRLLLVHREPINPATLPFLDVAGLLREMGVPVPAILDTAADLGILVLEDLGDITLEAHLAGVTESERIALYSEAIDLIVRMQKRGRDLSGTMHLPFRLAFDEEKLTAELEFFVEHFLIRYRGADPSADRRHALAGEFTRLARELAALPRVFCHRDFHSRNLMWHAGRLYVIDFQDARMGPDAYDLVSLLRDCYVANPPSVEGAMLERFVERTGTKPGRAFRTRVDLMAVQRHLKALGTFGYQTATVKSDRYHDAIPRTLGYLADVFHRRPRFDQLRALLADDIPELS